MQSHQTSRASAKMNYSEVRNEIKDGDVLMYQGKSLVSRLIQLFTRSAYSHAGLAVWWNERLMVMEAVGKGVVVTPLSANVGHYHGNVEWFTCIEDIPTADRTRMIQFAQQELGKQYATWKLIVFGIFILFNMKKDRRDELRREKKLFCSHYVSQVYNSVGKDLKENESDSFMSPDDVAKSKLLKKMGILKRD